MLSDYVKGRLELTEFQCLLSVLRKVCKYDYYDKKRAKLITLSCQPELLNQFPTIVETASKGKATTLESVVNNVVLFTNAVTKLLPLMAILFKITIQSCLSKLQHGLTPKTKLVEQKLKNLLKDLQALKPDVDEGKNCCSNDHPCQKLCHKKCVLRGIKVCLVYC